MMLHVRIINPLAFPPKSCWPFTWVSKHCKRRTYSILAFADTTSELILSPGFENASDCISQSGGFWELGKNRIWVQWARVSGNPSCRHFPKTWAHRWNRNSQQVGESPHLASWSPEWRWSWKEEIKWKPTELASLLNYRNKIKIAFLGRKAEISASIRTQKFQVHVFFHSPIWLLVWAVW